MSLCSRIIRVVCVTAACLSMDAATRRIPIDTTEGTWMSLDVSPDGQTIVFDLLGDLYSIPVSGGDATRLTSLPKTAPGEFNGGQPFDSQPRFSPDGKQIAFISDRDGSDNLYLAQPDGREVRRLSSGRNVMSSPAWSRDGRFIAVRIQQIRPYEAAGHGGELWIYGVDDGVGHKLSTGLSTAVNGIEFAPDGTALYFSAPASSRDFRHKLWRLDRTEAKAVQLTDHFGGAVRARFSPDGKRLFFATFDDGETVLREREMDTGRERTIIRGIEQDTQLHPGAMLDVLPGYGFSPDGKFVYLSYRGGIHRVTVADGSVRAIPFRVRTELEVGPKHEAKLKVPESEIPIKMLHWTEFSPDGNWAVFDAIGKIWVVSADGGKPRRLTNSSEREYAPSISPDGRWVAFVTWSDDRQGHVLKVPLRGGEARQLTDRPGFYVNPAWSPDGRKLVVGVGDGNELREFRTRSGTSKRCG